MTIFEDLMSIKKALNKLINLQDQIILVDEVWIDIDFYIEEKIAGAFDLAEHVPQKLPVITETVHRGIRPRGVDHELQDERDLIINVANDYRGWAASLRRPPCSPSQDHSPHRHPHVHDARYHESQAGQSSATMAMMESRCSVRRPVMGNDGVL